jgi:hypothetical protein
MSTLEIKSIIAKYLEEIDDKDFLNAIRTILETRLEKNVYQLSRDEKSRLDEARAEYKVGNAIPHEEVKKNIKKWMDSK